MNKGLISFVTDVRVRYADTDQMKFAYYGKFFEYFEQGRSDLLRHIGLPYSSIEALGVLVPVLEAHAVYKISARYDDLLHIRTELRELPQVKFRIDYTVTRNDDPRISAEGYTVHTFISASNGRPVRAPQEFLTAIQNAH